jgi:hypothetical protein
MAGNQPAATDQNQDGDGNENRIPMKKPLWQIDC